ncbi:MAG TPA: type I glyceraldehyde-3-phosphate dehydrogenase [Rhodocyclaceae bacterium]|nr:type I glyceraldehyde-3-phosphate dehydrogenase [Rhodocyclaceae bacterium]
MSIKIAINGYGRIGRCTLRAIWEQGLENEFEVVAINASGDIKTNAHLTKYDTTHGRFAASVETDGDNCMIIGGKRIPFFSTKDPLAINWAELGVDVLLECTGAYTSKAKAEVLLQQGAKKVLISAPGGDDVDATIVYGVNHEILTAAMTVVSNASCTTNCLAPVAKVLQDNIGIEQGLMTTIHAFTNDQVLVDVRHKDLRRARAAAHNIIPTKTGAAAAVGLVLPALKGKVDGFALRVPTINVSLVDLTFTAGRETSKDEVNQLMKTAANGTLKGILAVNEEPLVSSDFNHSTVSSTFDATQTRVIKGADGSTLVKVLAWYDNEWGYSCRMLDAARALADAR